MSNFGPFTRAILVLNYRGMTYQQMEQKSKRVRSSVWFNNLANGHYVHPPKKEELGKFAELFGTTRRHVGLMVAEQWLGITYRNVAPVALELEPILTALNDEDQEMVRKLAQRLASTDGAEEAA
jgi:hypothetical protein